MEDLISGLIVKAVSSTYFVDCSGTVYGCKARGVFRNRDIKPLVGDKVDITALSEETKEGCIIDVHPRKNSLIRPSVANIDTLVIVSSMSLPRPSAIVIDRLTASAEYRDIPPALVFNKTDEGSADEYAGMYSKTKYPYFCVSAETGEGIDKLRSYLSGKIAAFCGNTGVGKSSLLNRICPDACMATGDVSLSLKRGKHTTRHIELVKTDDGGYIADTPGFSSWDFTGGNRISKEDLQYCFSEFEEYIPRCKYASCTHVKEQGCAVIDAAAQGRISAERHSSYVAIYNELSGINEWD